MITIEGCLICAISGEDVRREAENTGTPLVRQLVGAPNCFDD